MKSIKHPIAVHAMEKRLSRSWLMLAKFPKPTSSARERSFVTTTSVL